MKSYQVGNKVGAKRIAKIAFALEGTDVTIGSIPLVGVVVHADSPGDEEWFELSFEDGTVYITPRGGRHFSIMIRLADLEPTQ